jgi:hypothetical protein
VGAICAYVADNPAKAFAGPRSRGLNATVASGDDVDAEITAFAELDEARAWSP